MFDGSSLPLGENLELARQLLADCAAAYVILEIEIGVVGGEEDGIAGAVDDKLYSSPEDALAAVDALGLGENGRYLTALTFGNVHGAYKPGKVKLRPDLLRAAQAAITTKHGLTEGSKPLYLVFHGGSGSTQEEIATAVRYGVVKMHVDADNQYAFTRAAAGHMFPNYDRVLKIDDQVGDKSSHDPRVWGALAESSMAARVTQACEELGSAGTQLR
jgi:fructose-bisphosphate aldolase, class II